mmetsp:Transcript_4945/g.17891  ORF Transcript_4945/g.17891 Transcript_4945/m.17891 type:complete len:651 (+) Transcript_4945:3243-5195(+)
MGRLALRLAALHEGTDAVNDLSGPFGLLGGLLQRRHQRVLVDAVVADPADHAVAVVGDRGQRLVQLVGDAGGHLAHGHQPAGHLRLLGLQCGLGLGMAAHRDVGGDQHLGQPPVGPLQVAGAHVEPHRQRLHVHLARVGSDVGQRLGRQARVVVHLVGAVGQAASAGGADQLAARQQCVAGGVGTEPEPVAAVGEQQLRRLHRQHGHGGVQAFEHRGEAFVRGGELVAHPLGLGDVGHRGHPACLLALGVDQGRHIDAGIEEAAVLALDLDLHATRGAAALQLLLQQAGVFLAPVGRPEGVGRRAADEVGLRKTGHRAEGRVHVGDARVHVHRAHAGQHGVLHRPAEIGFQRQRALDLGAAAHVAPGAEQHPDGQAGEGQHHPEQRVADQADRGAPALAPQHQAVEGGRQRHVMQQRRAAQHLAGHRRDGAADDLLAGIEHRDAVSRGDFAGHVVAQQGLDGVFRDQHAGEAAAVDQRDVQLEDDGAVGVREGRRVDRLAALLGGFEGDLGRIRLVGHGHGRVVAIRRHQAVRLEAGRADAAAAPALGAQPGHMGQLRALAREGLGLGRELVGVDLACDHLAGDTRQLLLVLDQPQPDLLLGDLGVALDALGLTLDLLVAQIPEGRNDGGQEKQHRDQRPQRGQAVLARG